jgi:hypothetical protein
VTPLHPVGVIARYVVLGAGLGVLAGLAWVLLAPRVLVNGEDLVAAYPEGFAAADLTLGLILGLAGVGLGIVAARRLRATCFIGGWAQVAGMIAGGLACGGVARVVGWWLRDWGRAAQSDSLPLTVGANGVLLLAVLTGLLVLVFYAGFARDSPPEAPAEARAHGPESAEGTS